MKFYPADWRADAMLRLCSIAARGLWTEMMCIMHDAERYGSLLVNGKRIDKKQLAGLAGISEKDCSSLLLELEGNGVFSRDDDGTIYSRRMRRDFEKAAKDKENGKGGGNPGLKGVVKRGVNPPDKGEDKAHIPNATAKEEDGIGPRGSAFTEASKALSHALWRGLSIESPLEIPNELAGADWRALEWDRAGWTPDLIEAECRRIGPGKPLSYYEKCFASAFAKRQAPLPNVEIRQAETITVTHGPSHDRSAHSLVASIHRELAEIERAEGDDFALAASPVQLLPSGPVRRS